MQTFGEQLAAARKAKGITQDELAQSANVARNTVSSWERDRTQPDLDMIRRLSDILGVDFSQAAQGQSAAPATENAASEGQPLPQAAGKKRIKTWWIIAGAAALICAVVLCVLLIPRKPVPENGGDKFDPAYYTQEVPNEAGKAYLSFDKKVWEEKNGTDEFQYYVFNIKEDNGVGFSITRIETQMEGKGGAIRAINLAADDLRSFMLEPDLVPYGTMPLQGGFPKGEILRVGIAVYGNDANGEPMIFYSLLEF